MPNCAYDGIMAVSEQERSISHAIINADSMISSCNLASPGMLCKERVGAVVPHWAVYSARQNFFCSGKSLLGSRLQSMVCSLSRYKNSLVACCAIETAPELQASFSVLIEEFKKLVSENKHVLVHLLAKRPNLAYKEVLELARITGSRYGVDFQIHFPVRSKLFDVESYGTENVSIVIDKFRRRFPLPRTKIKARISELLGSSPDSIHDAYMYEDKEGIRAMLQGGRIEVLPGSMHFWCIIDDRTKSVGDWLISEVYSNP